MTVGRPAPPRATDPRRPPLPRAVVDAVLHLAMVTTLGFLLIRYLKLLVLEAGVLLRHPAARRSWLDQHAVIAPQTEVKGRGMSPQMRG